MPTSQYVPGTALSAQASALPQPTNMLFDTLSVPTAAMQDFSAAFDVQKRQHHFQPMLIVLHSQANSSTQLQANSSNAFQSNISNVLPTSQYFPRTALSAQASALPQPTNMLFDTLSVPAAAMQDFSAAFDVQKRQRHFQPMLIVLHSQANSSTQLQANSSNAFQSNISNVLPTSQYFPGTALSAQASALPQPTNMLFDTLSVPAAAMQNFSAAFDVQTPASLSVAASCSPFSQYIVETVLLNQFVDFTLLLPKNLDKLPKLLTSQTHLARIVCAEMSPFKNLAIGVMHWMSLWRFLPKKNRWEKLLD